MVDVWKVKDGIECGWCNVGLVQCHLSDGVSDGM